MIVTVKSSKGERYNKFVKNLKLWTSKQPFNSDFYSRKKITEVTNHLYHEPLGLLLLLIQNNNVRIQDGDHSIPTVAFSRQISDNLGSSVEGAVRPDCEGEVPLSSSLPSQWPLS